MSTDISPPGCSITEHTTNATPQPHKFLYGCVDGWMVCACVCVCVWVCACLCALYPYRYAIDYRPCITRQLRLLVQRPPQPNGQWGAHPPVAEWPCLQGRLAQCTLRTPRGCHRAHLQGGGELLVHLVREWGRGCEGEGVRE